MTARDISCVVVTCNEAAHLRACLPGLRSSGEVIVVDLESEDGSASVAEEAGARVLRHARVPVVEEARRFAVPLAAHDWVFFVDPDERIPATMVDAVASAIGTHLRAGVIWLPYRYYFRGKPLDHTFWGRKGIASPRVVHRERVDFMPDVHRGFALRPGFETVRLDESDAGAVDHYWAAGWRDLFRKHWRYVRREGAAMSAAGRRFSARGCASAARRTLRADLVTHGGRRSLTGIALCLFHAAYVLASYLSLRAHERRTRTGRE